jgi:hypothetical protein
MCITKGPFQSGNVEMPSVPYSYECDTDSGLAADPDAPKRVGYVTSLGGFGFNVGLDPDLTINLPFRTPIPTYKGLGSVTNGIIKVVGVIRKFAWDGTADGPIDIDLLVSHQNAIKSRIFQQTNSVSTAIQQFGLKPSKLTMGGVLELGWWIIDYDHAKACWYEKSFPESPPAILGQAANSGSPALSVDLTPTMVKQASLYKASIAVVPAEDRSYVLRFAGSSTDVSLKNWGQPAGTPSARLP